MMETMLLRDKEQYPAGEILKDALGGSYGPFSELMAKISGNEFGLVHEWHYFNDGKAWLCKVIYKKKTIFWLSVWEGCFKTTFYFTEKSGAGIAELDIKDNLKKDFAAGKPVGRLHALVMVISRREQLPDLLKVIAYKKSIR